jgi:hypothetical protein
MLTLNCFVEIVNKINSVDVFYSNEHDHQKVWEALSNFFCQRFLGNYISAIVCVVKNNSRDVVHRDINKIVKIFDIDKHVSDGAFIAE